MFVHSLGGGADEPDARDRCKDRRAVGRVASTTQEPALRGGARRSIRRAVDGTLPARQMGGAGRHARHLLPAAVRSLGPRAQRAEPGGAGRSRAPPLLFLLHRALAAGGLLLHRAADRRRADAVPDERARGPRVVRLSVPADRVDRSLRRGRALGRGRPARAHAEGRRPVRRALRGARRSPSTRSGWSSPGGPAAPGCSISPTRRRWCGACDAPGARDRLWLDRDPDVHDLCASPASCASRCASTCARGRASRPR